MEVFLERQIHIYIDIMDALRFRQNGHSAAAEGKGWCRVYSNANDSATQRSSDRKRKQVTFCKLFANFLQTSDKRRAKSEDWRVNGGEEEVAHVAPRGKR